MTPFERERARRQHQPRHYRREVPPSNAADFLLGLLLVIGGATIAFAAVMLSWP